MTENKLRVLYVDDDPFLRDMYAIKFVKAGIDFKAYATGSDLMKDLVDTKIVADVVLLDIIMPGDDGLKILENIRKNNILPEAAMIMLANQSGALELDRAKELGAAGYIVKANNIPSEVVEKVKKIYADFKAKK